METEQSVRKLLNEVACHECTVDDALANLRSLPFQYENLGFARIDHQRELRRGHPEVIYCASKTPAQVAEIFARMAERSPRVLATRAASAHAAAVQEKLGDEVRYDPMSLTLWLNRDPDRPKREGITIVAAGTSDIPVCEEARITLDLFGYATEQIYDIGVAGLHRLLGELPALRRAKVIILAAGMEAALTSVVAGLVRVPVIAVPTHVGYGASFGGLAALLGMLNSCSPGVAVVNIDNGFGAAYLAATILDLHPPDAPRERGG